MPYDFDRVIDRRSTESNKWHKFPPDVLPLWVADMDFPSPEPVIRALRERVEHGFFGYGADQPEFFEIMCDRLLKRCGWKVDPEAIVPLPGVPSKVQRGGNWTLQRLQREVAPPERALFDGHGLRLRVSEDQFAGPCDGRSYRLELCYQQQRRRRPELWPRRAGSAR